jgi:hypothetical protein
VASLSYWHDSLDPADSFEPRAALASDGGYGGPERVVAKAGGPAAVTSMAREMQCSVDVVGTADPFRQRRR